MPASVICPGMDPFFIISRRCTQCTNTKKRCCPLPTWGNIFIDGYDGLSALPAPSDQISSLLLPGRASSNISKCELPGTPESLWCGAVYDEPTNCMKTAAPVGSKVGIVVAETQQSKLDKTTGPS